MIEAWNKIDALGEEEAAAVRAEAARREDVVPLSALTGEGVEDLLRCAATKLSAGNRVLTVTLPVTAGDAIAWLHANGEVLGQSHEGLETALEVRMSKADWARFKAGFGVLPRVVEDQA